MGDRDSIDVSSIGGSFANPNPVPGHAVRAATLDLSRYPQSNEDPYDAIVVGGGISGLAALWKLKNAGIERVLLLELGARCGGTSLGGKIDGMGFPWGAH